MIVSVPLKDNLYYDPIVVSVARNDNHYPPQYILLGYTDIFTDYYDFGAFLHDNAPRKKNFFFRFIARDPMDAR